MAPLGCCRTRLCSALFVTSAPGSSYSRNLVVG
jgi:hypothetical protein